MASRDLLCISLKVATSSSFSPAWKPVCFHTDNWTPHSGIRGERSEKEEIIVESSFRDCCASYPDSVLLITGKSVPQTEKEEPTWLM